VTNETVVFDSWAWWEVIHATPVGQGLVERYISAKGTALLTVDYTLAEIAAKLARVGLVEDVPEALSEVETLSDILPISVEVAGLAAPLLIELRRTDPSASLADAVVLAAARLHRAALISGDPCYAGQTDVRAS